jgi:hypothetical protein
MGVEGNVGVAEHSNSQEQCEVSSVLTLSVTVRSHLLGVWIESVVRLGDASI